MAPTSLVGIVACAPHSLMVWCRCGDDINAVVDKLQHLDKSLRSSELERGPGMVPDWDYVNPTSVYREYNTSPYQSMRCYS